MGWGFFPVSLSLEWLCRQFVFSSPHLKILLVWLIDWSNLIINDQLTWRLSHLAPERKREGMESSTRLKDSSLFLSREKKRVIIRFRWRQNSRKIHANQSINQWNRFCNIVTAQTQPSYEQAQGFMSLLCVHTSEDTRNFSEIESVSSSSVIIILIHTHTHPLRRRHGRKGVGPMAWISSGWKKEWIIFMREGGRGGPLIIIIKIHMIYKSDYQLCVCAPIASMIFLFSLPFALSSSDCIINSLISIAL